ncbi:response regulator [Pelosinus sp. sgz500959]|uniref:response regulator n=1 Tax=Pelosinus sp. sgz500959 TaxID=3242472 RepID=UPI00366EC87F
MKSVLIVDDTMFMRLSLKTMLVKNGFNVVGEAENGAIAVEKYQQLNPDIVTMDITMPEVDGVEALKRIRAIDGQAKVVMVSAMGQEAMIRNAVMAGAKNFIVKPFTEETVMKVLSKL